MARTPTLVVSLLGLVGLAAQGSLQEATSVIVETPADRSPFNAPECGSRWRRPRGWCRIATWLQRS
jgi:hypothetical protein